VKKGISISLLLLIISAMLKFSVATHYCGGHVAASKISVTGKLASCGMEGSQNEVLPNGKYLSKHCCEDVVVSISTDNNYVPSFYNIPDTFQFGFQTSVLPSESSVGLAGIFRLQYSDISPPWAMMSTDVDLSGICVFRI
jgi:hypothetical protein